MCNENKIKYNKYNNHISSVGRQRYTIIYNQEKLYYE